jgi:hypothetical protein
MNGGIVKEQREENFELFVGYTPQASTLVKGWRLQIFRYMGEVNKTMQK